MARDLPLQCSIQAASVFEEMRSSSSSNSSSSNDLKGLLPSKRHRTLEARKVGWFRHFFYDNVKALVDDLSLMGDYKLQFIGGALYLWLNDDALPLLSFSKQLVQDKTGVEAHYDTFERYGVNRATVDTLVENSLNAAEEEME